MAWDPIDETELVPGNPILKHMRQTWNSVKYLFGLLGTLAASGVQNGSFEVDADEGGQPDNWVLNTYPGGSGGIVTDVPAHGKNAVQLVHPGGAGNGGGYYESDYVTCSGLHKIYLGFIHWATVAEMRDQVIVRWYDKAKVFVSSAALYDSTNNPTSAAYFIMAMQPPAGARFYKLQLVGGYSDTNVAGTAYFDGVGEVGMQLFTPLSASGTVAQVANSEAMADVASMTFRVPLLGIPVKISFTAEAWHENYLDQYVAYLRFRVGTAYSNQLNVPGGQSATAATFVINVSAVDATGMVTVHMQLGTNAGGNAYGRKTSSGITVQTTIAQA